MVVVLGVLAYEGCADECFSSVADESCGSVGAVVVACDVVGELLGVLGVVPFLFCHGSWRIVGRSGL